MNDDFYIKAGRSAGQVFDRLDCLRPKSSHQVLLLLLPNHANEQA